MKRQNLAGGNYIEVEALALRVARIVKAPAERSGDDTNRVLGFLKTGEVIELSEFEAEALRDLGVKTGTLDEIVTVTFYETKDDFVLRVEEDMEKDTEAPLDPVYEETWVLRRCNIPLALSKFVGYRKVMIGMQSSALDLKEGRVTQEEVDEQVRKANEERENGPLGFLKHLIDALDD